MGDECARDERAEEASVQKGVQEMSVQESADELLSRRVCR